MAKAKVLPARPRAADGRPITDVDGKRVTDADGSSVVDAAVQTLRAGRAASAPRSDRLAVEAPLEMRLGGKAATVLMRMPGDDEELVRGFLFSEGMIARANDIVALSRPPGLTGDERGNVISVELSPKLRLPPFERLFYSSSSCGVCGKTSIASLAVRAQPSTSRISVRRSVLGALPARMRQAQDAFLQTGGVHASGLFLPDGALIAVREDVGRHNALDKIIGWGLAEGRVPFTDHVLLVSGRVSFEIIQKAIAAGLPFVAAVGAPSSLAVDLAEQFGLTLVGFLREDSMNVYANGQRVAEG